MLVIQVFKIASEFVLALRAKYLEQKWYKKVFYQKDGAHAAIFSEAQQHSISGYQIRKEVIFGGVVPISVKFQLSHLLIIASVLQAQLLKLLD